MRKFKDDRLQCLYLMMLYNPPTRFIQHKQKEYRRTGSSMYFPFWYGYDGLKCREPKNSISYVVYCAGVDYKKLNGKDYPK